VKADSDYNYLTKFNSITPYYTESTITPIDCTTLGPCELYTTWFLYCTTPFVHSKNKGKAQKTHPTPHTMCHRHRPPHLTKTSPHTCKYKAVSYPSNPLPVSTHNTPLFIRSIWFAEQTLSLREQTHRGHIARKQKTDIPAYHTTGL
jgi:hypothetical protein